MAPYNDPSAMIRGNVQTFPFLNYFYTNYSQLGVPLQQPYDQAHQQTIQQPLQQTFPLMKQLPLELRMEIWKAALHHNRLIGIEVVHMRHLPSLHYQQYTPPPYTEKHKLKDNKGNVVSENIISGGDYAIWITTEGTGSPLMLVSHESREAALGIYRVRMPIKYPVGDYHPASARFLKRYLYFNPELDFLSISTSDVGAAEDLVDFIHDIKAYDPRGIGLQNLAIGKSYRTGDQLGVTDLPIKPHLLAPQALATFSETISNLKHVFFRDVVKGDQGFEPLGSMRYNLSFPRFTHVESFDLLDTDPRPIDRDLETVFCSSDIGSQVRYWQKMERAFQIRRSPSTQFQVLLATLSNAHLQPGITRSRRDAELHINAEEANYFEPAIYTSPGATQSFAEAPIPVVGFWLFPLEAFEGVPENPGAEDLRAYNLSNYRPQLGVSCLLYRIRGLLTGAARRCSTEN